MAYPRITDHRLREVSPAILVTEYRRVTRLQAIWRLTHDGCEHAEHYNYLVRIKEELARRNVTIQHPENQDEPEPPEGDPSSAEG